jgi:hypothetical protein
VLGRLARKHRDEFFFCVNDQRWTELPQLEPPELHLLDEGRGVVDPALESHGMPSRLMDVGIVGMRNDPSHVIALRKADGETTIVQREPTPTLAELIKEKSVHFPIMDV